MAGYAATEYDTQEELLETVGDYIRAFSSHPYGGTMVGNVLDEIVDTRGKMLRPRLLLLAGEFGPGYEAARDRLCKVAAMVELTHMASLIHDDIVDDAPLRRGRPSVQSRFGKDAAVYAGDFLMSRISYYMLKEGFNRPGAVLANTVEQMCAGEIGQALCRYREDVTLQDYRNNIHGKTAALFMAACRIGAEESGCTPELADRLERLGEELGLLFQLRDDLLDFTSTTKAIGKEAHRDFQEGIYTMPVLCALAKPGGREKLLPILRANARGALTGEDLLCMERLVTELGGVEDTKRELLERQRNVERLAKAILPRTGAARMILAMMSRWRIL